MRPTQGRTMRDVVRIASPIIRHVCEAYGLQASELLGGSRSRALDVPYRWVVRLLAERTELHPAEIAAAVGRTPGAVRTLLARIKREERMTAVLHEKNTPS